MSLRNWVIWACVILVLTLVSGVFWAVVLGLFTHQPDTILPPPDIPGYHVVYFSITYIDGVASIDILEPPQATGCSLRWVCDD